MRIAYLCQSYPPMVSGASICAQHLAEGMAARGHNVLVLAASDQGRAYSLERGNLLLVRLRSFPNPARAGQHFMIWPENGAAAVLQAFRPDMLHLHDTSTTGLAALRAAETLDIPIVLTIHLLPLAIAAYVLPALRKGIETALWAYGKWLIGKCTTVITPSKFAAAAVQVHGGRCPHVISNGVDLRRFCRFPAFAGEGEALRRKYGLPPGLPVILYVGRVDVEKRIDLLVQAAARAIRATDAQLLVLGDGTQRAAAMKLCREMCIRNRCHFPGFVLPSDDLPGLFRLADVFVTASEYETQGIAVLEAAASGLPVVCPRLSALPELVMDGQSGYLVPPGDVEAMADRLVSLLQDPSLARAMGQAGRAMARRHAVEFTLQAHEQLYRTLLAPTGSDGGRIRQ